MEKITTTPATQEGLTQEDIELQEVEKRVDQMGESVPVGLAEAIARSEMLDELKATMRRVPEGIFVRDILPAIAGKLGNVNMRWWVDQFGSVYSGFLVVNPDNEVMFEFPPMAPSPSTNASRENKPVGDSLANFRNSVQARGVESIDKLKTDLRRNLSGQGIESYIYNIATVERICRRYDTSIIAEAKPEFSSVINQAVAGLDEAFGPLGKVGAPIPASKTATVTATRDPYDDDDEQAGEGTFD